MDTSTFDQKIQQLEQTVKTLRAELENVCKAFQEATRKYLDQYFQSKTEKEVEENSQVALSLGSEGLKKVKVDLSNLKSQIPELVQKHLDKDSLWLHRSNDPKTLKKARETYTRYNSKSNEGLDGAVRVLLGYLGQLLHRHRFIDFGERSEWIDEYGVGVRYRYGYDWSNEMNEVLKMYSDSFEKYLRITDELESTKQDKLSAQAKDLWNKA